MDFNSLILTNLSPVLSYVNFIYINYSHRWLIVPNTFDIHKTLHADKGCMQRLCLSGPILYTPIDYQLPELNIDWTFKCRSFWMNWLTYFCHYRQSIDTKEFIQDSLIVIPPLYQYWKWYVQMYTYIYIHATYLLLLGLIISRQTYKLFKIYMAILIRKE